MTFAVHRSDEPTARERGAAFGRAHAPAIRHSIAVYERMFAETGVAAGDIRVPDWAHEELSAMAEGAGVPLDSLLAVNARTEVLSGAGPTECSVVGAGGLLAQNWDWHPDLSESTIIWVVENGSGWFVTLCEAGTLAKIGLNDAGLGVCLNLLRSSEDGGHDGTPIHILLRQVLATCRSVDQAIGLLASTKVTASSAVTVAQPGDVASVELSPGGANVIRGSIGAHTNHFLEPPKRGRDTMDSVSTVPRLGVVRSAPLLDALRSHAGHPNGVCRHLDESLPWAEQVVTVASVVMNLAALRFHVAPGQPCTHEHEQITLPLQPSSDRLAAISAR